MTPFTILGNIKTHSSPPAGITIEEVALGVKSGSGTTATATSPATLNAGDLLLAVVVEDNSKTASVDHTNTGWTSLGSVGSTTSDVFITALWQEYVSGTPDWTWGLQDTTDDAIIWVFRITGHHSAPISNSNNNEDLSTSINLAITPSHDDCLILSFVGFDGGDGANFTLSGTGWTEGGEDINIDSTGSGGSGGASGSWGYNQQEGSPASTTPSWSASASSDGICIYNVAIRPA